MLQPRKGSVSRVYIFCISVSAEDIAATSCKAKLDIKQAFVVTQCATSCEISYSISRCHVAFHSFSVTQCILPDAAQCWSPTQPSRVNKAAQGLPLPQECDNSHKQGKQQHTCQHNACNEQLVPGPVVVQTPRPRCTCAGLVCLQAQTWGIEHSRSLAAGADNWKGELTMLPVQVTRNHAEQGSCTCSK